MDTTAEDIYFDKDGICNYCTNFLKRQNKTVNLSHNEACKQLVGMGELRSSTFERYSMKKRLNVKNDMIFDALR